jgi:hypothetical protein
MSVYPPADDNGLDDGKEWPEDYREEIEREANSDAPDAWVFQRLLAVHFEDGGSS